MNFVSSKVPIRVCIAVAKVPALLYKCLYNVRVQWCLIIYVFERMVCSTGYAQYLRRAWLDQLDVVFLSSLSFCLMLCRNVVVQIHSQNVRPLSRPVAMISRVVIQICDVPFALTPREGVVELICRPVLPSRTCL